MRFHLPFLLCLMLLPTASAARPAWLAPTQERAHEFIRQWEHDSQNVTAEFKSYELRTPVTVGDAESPMPEAAADESVVVCDGAMLFDTESARLVYIGNVRLTDPRLQLRARHYLFIRPTKDSISEKEQQANHAVRGSRDSLGGGDAIEVEPMRNSRPDDLPGNMARPLIETEDAVVDIENNLIILASPVGGCAISAVSGENTLLITTSSEKPAHVIVDSEGNMLLTGATIDISHRDAQGQLTKLHSKGELCFCAKENTMVLTGGGQLRSPEGEVHFSDFLTAKLRLERPNAPKDGFMQQFAGLNYCGLAAIHAEGAVVADRRIAGQPTAHLEGEVLDYNADTGLCSVQGEECRIRYGANSLNGAQRIVLQPDGELVLSGRELGGEYERPATGEQRTQRGRFRTSGEITYTDAGDHGVILLPQGISMADEGGDFSCEGPIELHLRPAEKESSLPKLPDSKLNLALARYAQIAYVKAQGRIIAHQHEQDNAPSAELSAASAELDFTTGALRLNGSADIPAVVAYDNNRLEATASDSLLPVLSLASNGDIELRGADINTRFNSKDGTISAHCKDFLRLVRAECRLETGSASEIRSAQGVMQTKAPLHAKLSVRESGSAPRTSFLPTLSFPYNGILEVSTPQGGSVQTAKGSLQCSGLMRVTMAPEPGAEYGELQWAEANGHVAIAGKDKNGRPMRATGERLTIDMKTGEKLLSGGTVTLSDAFNTHSASGGNAAVRIDAQNNARISGAVQKTSVNRISEQVNQQKTKKK